MKQVLFISGKGGTGKTSLTAAVAHLGAPLVLADCDVDAADLHLLATPDMEYSQTEAFESGNFAVVDPGKCTHCEICMQYCRFDAISMRSSGGKATAAYIDPLFCEGCGVCVDHCPDLAIAQRPRLAGEMLTCPTRFGTMLYGRLDAGQSNSGKLVALARARAAAAATEQGAEVVLVDGPPGVGCPVIASLNGVDLAVIVAEPTVSSRHDMQRVLELCAHFGITPAVIINKADINAGIARQIGQLCAEREIVLLGSVNYDEAFVHAVVAGKTITEAEPQSDAAQAIGAIWRRLAEYLSLRA